VGLFSSRKSREAEAETEEQNRLQDQARKNHTDSIIGRIDVWLEQLESHRAPDSHELADDLLGRIGGAPIPIAANAQEANHSIFITDYAMARSYATRIANSNSFDLSAAIDDAREAGDPENMTRLKDLQRFWSSVELYCSQL
jgi:hypothetical protein